MTRDKLRDEHGITMIAVLLVMLVATALSGAALTAAESDLGFAGASKDRKQAYSAAEAGVEYYLYQLTQDNDYWTNCATVPAPAPVNQKWDGAAADPRVWRGLPGTKAEYTIELLPNATSATCVAGSAESTLLDAETGTFKIRATGRDGDTTRSIVTSFRRRSFLDFLYFTDFETLDPSAYTGSNPPDSPGWATTNCSAWRQFRDSACKDITFISADANRGPFHTNDSILACGGYTLGRKKSDRIEISQNFGTNGVVAAGTGGSCNAGPPDFKGTVFNPYDTLTLPTTNAALKAEAVKDGIVFTGTTTIVLKGNVMDVWDSANVLTANMPLPNNGVIYVENGACPATQSPLLQNYDEAPGCANVTVSGSYSKNLTIGSRKDIIIGPQLDPATGRPTSSNGDLTRSGDFVLGLIADSFVRIQHAVDRTNPASVGNCTNRVAPDGQPIENITIEAAMLSLQHSFINDNYACGDKMGTITVKGAIAQKFRGPVGTFGGSGSGYIKDYNYDDRLRYRSPPFFLDPVSAAWGVVRQNEQVPATR